MSVEPMLAARTTTFPAAHALPGGCWYEPKWDGFRAIATVDGHVRLASRRGADLTEAFPEVVDALASQLSDIVVDGELVVWGGDRLDFAALQRRSSAGARRAAELAAATPANLVLFDVVEHHGEDLRPRPYRRRRELLVELSGRLAPPLSITPATDDPDLAARWFTQYAQVGVEGLVAKGADQPYRPGHRGWLKYRHTTTTELLVGAVDGPLHAPTRLVLAAWDADGSLQAVGATSVLAADAGRRIATALTPAGVDHPWPEQLPGHLLGGLAGQRRPTDITRVDPSTVVEVVVDTAFEGGRWRHPIRLVRVRTDIDPAEVVLDTPTAPDSHGHGPR